MSTSISDYVDIEQKYELVKGKAYYINPLVIKMLIIDEIGLKMNYKEIVDFVKSASIHITHEEIIKSVESYDSYTLTYFKNYIGALKKKFRSLFELIEILTTISQGKEVDEDELEQIMNLDFHIDFHGNLYLVDVYRLIDAFVYNFKDLYEKVTLGNDVNTYKTFTVSYHGLKRDGVFPSEIYPHKEVQINDLFFRGNREFIALSEDQENKLRSKRDKNDYFIKRISKK